MEKEWILKANHHEDIFWRIFINPPKFDRSLSRKMSLGISLE